MPPPLDPRLVRRSRPVRRFLVACALLGTLTGAAAVAQAWLLADVVVALVDARAVLLTTAALAAVVVLRGLLGWAQAVTGTRAAAAVKADLRREFVESALDPHRRDAGPSSAAHAALVDSGLDALDGYVARFLPQVAVTVAVPVLVMATLLVVDPLSALVVVLTLPLVVVFLVLVGLVTQDRLDGRWAGLQRLGRHFSDVLDGLVVLSGFGRDSERGIREVGERHRRATVESLRTAFTSALVLELFSTLSVAIVAVTAGLRLVSGGLDLHTGFLVIVLAPEAYLPLRRLGSLFHDGAPGVSAAGEALDLLSAERHEGTVRTDGPAVLRAEDLEVVLAGRGTPALHLPDAEVRPGEVVAVTGPSGGGKSTLLAVLLGFVAPTAGRVRVGDHDLADLDVEHWRRGLAWVPQVPSLLAGTVADNVRVGHADAAEHDVRAALDDAGAADLDLRRQVGEGGRGLSAGERRRVGVARALLRVRLGGAWLVLLDEPTAGLDADRERRVLQTVRSLGATVLVVAHRPDTVAAADRELRVGPSAVAGAGSR